VHHLASKRSQPLDELTRERRLPDPAHAVDADPQRVVELAGRQVAGHLVEDLRAFGAHGTSVGGPGFRTSGGSAVGKPTMVTPHVRCLVRLIRPSPSLVTL
jgi:hypothetical protein